MHTPTQPLFKLRLLIALAWLLAIAPLAYAQPPNWQRYMHYWPMHPSAYGQALSLQYANATSDLRDYHDADSLQDVGTLSSLRTYNDRNGAPTAAYGKRIVTRPTVATVISGTFGVPTGIPFSRVFGERQSFYQYGLSFWVRLSREDTINPTSSPSANDVRTVFSYGNNDIRVAMEHVSQNAMMNQNAQYRIHLQQNFGLGGSRLIQLPLTTNGQQTGPLGLFASQWLHVALFYENKKLYVFLNGQPSTEFNYLLEPSQDLSNFGNPALVAANDSVRITAGNILGTRARLGGSGVVMSDVFFGFVPRPNFLTSDSAIRAQYGAMALQMFNYCKQSPFLFSGTQDINTRRTQPHIFRYDVPPTHDINQRYFKYFVRTQGLSTSLSSSVTTTRYDSLLYISTDSLFRRDGPDYPRSAPTIFAKQVFPSDCFAFSRVDFKGPVNCPAFPQLRSERVGNAFLIRGTASVPGIDSIRWESYDYNTEAFIAAGTDTIVPLGTDSVFINGTVYVGDCQYRVLNESYLPGSSTGISPSAARSLSLYPNPTRGTLQLDMVLEQSTEVQVSNLAGMVVYRTTVSGTRPQLDLNHLPNGLYALHLNDGKTLWTGKVLLAR